MRPSLLYKDSQVERKMTQNIALLWYTLPKHIIPLSENMKWLSENIFYCTIFKALQTLGLSSLLSAVYEYIAEAGELPEASLTHLLPLCLADLSHRPTWIQR